MKQHFKQYNDLFYQVRELQSKIEELEEKLYSVNGVKYGDFPRVKGQSSDIVYKIQEITDLKEELSLLIQEKEAVKKVHLQEINQLDDEKHRSVLRCYFLEKMNNKTIADIVDVSISRFYSLRREAVNEFMIKIVANDKK